MDDTAWVRLLTFQKHPPSNWDEEAVSEFHGMLDALEQTYEVNLANFRIPDAKFKERVVSSVTPPLGTLRKCKCLRSVIAMNSSQSVNSEALLTT
jgi:hypothetical protein